MSVPAVIEFVGLPGAGKSVLSVKVAALLRARGLDVAEPTHVLNHRVGSARRRVTRVAVALRQIAVSPARSCAGARAIAATAQHRHRDFLKSLTAWLLALDTIGRTRAAVTILDQGLFQALWSIQWSAERETTRIAALAARALPPSMGVVIVETDPHVVRRRLAGRDAPASRLERHDDGDEALARGSDALERTRALIVHMSAAHPGLRHLTVDLSRDGALDDAARAIVDHFAGEEGH